MSGEQINHAEEARAARDEDRLETAHWALARLHVILIYKPLTPIVRWLAAKFERLGL